MTPLVLITGFLGSGKTTLLRFLVEQARSRRLVCIVNEFGSVDIDGQLIELPPGQLVALPGGSIFCACLVGEFIRVLGEVAAKIEAEAPVEPSPSTREGVNTPGAEGSAGINPAARCGVVVEASGMADPRVIGRMLAETRLDRSFELRRVVSVVDPGSFHKLLHTLPAITSQIEASDLVLVNKSDLYGSEQIARTRAAIRQINPAVQVIGTQHCRIELDLFEQAGQVSDEQTGGAEPRRSRGEYAPCRDPSYITRTIRLGRPVDHGRLMAVLDALKPHVFRAKGFVSTPGGWMYVDLSDSGLSCRPAPAGPDRSAELVVIAPPHGQPQIDAFGRDLGAGPSLAIIS